MKNPGKICSKSLAAPMRQCTRDLLNVSLPLQSPNVCLFNCPRCCKWPGICFHYCQEENSRTNWTGGPVRKTSWSWGVIWVHFGRNSQLSARCSISYLNWDHLQKSTQLLKNSKVKIFISKLLLYSGLLLNQTI